MTTREKTTKAGGPTDCKGTRLRCKSAEGEEHYLCYEPEIILALTRAFEPKPPMQKRVLLTCDQGHTFYYLVDG